MEIIYAKDGKLHRIRAKAAVMTTGPWVTKHLVADLPDDRRAALDRFLFAPMLVANVALRNWRFLDRLGFAAARWFDGFGFYATIRQPMALGANDPPFAPDKPIVMTFYIPIQNPDLPLEAQGPQGRMQMYGTSYADYERRLVTQMTRLFASGGFDARRDIAGIVLNRWGHAFVTPGPGFLLGTDGRPPSSAVVRQPFGRIAFGSSEDWLGSAHGGRRAVGEIARWL